MGPPLCFQQPACGAGQPHARPAASEALGVCGQQWAASVRFCSCRHSCLWSQRSEPFPRVGMFRLLHQASQAETSGGTSCLLGSTECSCRAMFPILASQKSCPPAIPHHVWCSVAALQRTASRLLCGLQREVAGAPYSCSPLAQKSRPSQEMVLRLSAGGGARGFPCYSSKTCKTDSSESRAGESSGQNCLGASPLVSERSAGVVPPGCDGIVVCLLQCLFRR